MQKAALLLLLLTAAVTAWFVVFADDVATTVEPGSAIEAALDEDIDGEAVDLVDEPGSAEPWTDKVPADATAQRTAMKGAQGAAGKPLEIQVWAGRRGVPAAAAEVFFFDVPRGQNPWSRSWRRRQQGPTAHWSELAIEKGRRYVTDAKGRVSLPAVSEWGLVTARRENEYGFVSVRRKHKPVEFVTLVPDETVRIHVVDGDGRAVANAPVAVQQQVPVRPRVDWGQLRNFSRMIRERAGPEVAAQRRMIEQLQRLVQAQQKKNGQARPKQKLATRLNIRARGVTGRDGIAEIRHFQLYRQNPEKWWGEGHADHYRAALLVPASAPVFAEFHGRPVPSAPIRLTMPPTGSVVVRVLDHNRTPFLHPANAELRVTGDDKHTWTRVRGRKEQGGHGIEFPFVGLGLQVRPHVWLDDRDFTWDGQVVAGPSRAGEQITIDVVAADRFGILRGRLVGADGKPLAGLRPSFLINGRAGRLEGEDLTVDADGRFQLMFQVGKRHFAPFSLEVREQRATPPRGLMTPLPALADGRTVDLGELKLLPYPAFVRGVVTDDARQPVAGAWVKLQRERLVGTKTPKKSFRDEAFVAVRTDKEGRYELFADPLPGRYRVSVQARSHFPATSPDVARGSKVDLTLTRTASLVGSCIAPKWMPDRGVRVRVVSAVDAKLSREERLRTAKGKSLRTFSVSWLRPGLYNVSVLVQGFPEPVLRVDGVRLDPGQRGTHPQLANLDLTTLLYRFVLHAIDQNGAALKVSGPLLAKVVRQGGRAEFVGFPWSGTKVEVFSASPQLEVVQLHTGYRARRAVVAHGESQLQFEKLPPVRLETPGLRALVGKDTTVRVSMVLTSETGYPTSLSARDQRTGRRRSYSRAQLSKSSGAWLGETDVMSVPLMHPGEYVVIARLRANGVSVPVTLGKGAVAFDSGVQPVVRVPVDPKKLAKGLATFAQQRQAAQAKAAAQKAAAQKRSAPRGRGRSRR